MVHPQPQNPGDWWRCPRHGSDPPGTRRVAMRCGAPHLACGDLRDSKLRARQVNPGLISTSWQIATHSYLSARNVPTARPGRGGRTSPGRPRPERATHPERVWQRRGLPAWRPGAGRGKRSSRGDGRRAGRGVKGVLKGPAAAHAGPERRPQPAALRHWRRQGPEARRAPGGAGPWRCPFKKGEEDGALPRGDESTAERAAPASVS